MRHKHDPTSVSQLLHIVWLHGQIHVSTPQLYTMQVSLYVAELQQETFNPVLIYKPQGECSSTHSSLPLESFVLAVQTEFQLDPYQRYASSVLCIDSTHGTNAYNFKLITCIVADQFGQGTCTVVYMLSQTMWLYDFFWKPHVNRSACWVVYIWQRKYRSDAHLPCITQREITRHCGQCTADWWW